LYFAEAPKRCSRFRNDRVESRIGVLPRLHNELVVVERRGAIAQPLREAGTLEHEGDPAIVGPIKQRSRLQASAGGRKEAKRHFAQPRSIGAQGVGECQEAIQR